VSSATTGYAKRNYYGGANDGRWDRHFNGWHTMRKNVFRIPV
jgi:hypothetical protein